MNLRKLIFPLVLFSITSSMASSATELLLSSPDRRRVVKFEKPGKELKYSIKVDGQEVILPSRAGLEVDNRTWEMALGKRDLALCKSTRPYETTTGIIPFAERMGYSRGYSKFYSEIKSSTQRGYRCAFYPIG